MSNSPSNSPSSQIIPLPTPQGLGSLVRPTSASDYPPEAKQLDGTPIAALTPGGNMFAEPTTAVPAQESASGTEFNLHEDGTLCKYVALPDRPPQCMIIDGAGRQMAVARNSDVADLICNGVNAMNMAAQAIKAENDAANNSAGGPPPAIITPGV